MEKQHTHHHTTHWNSFWFGFMVALATVLTCLLILTITDHISFDAPQKHIDLSRQESIPAETDASPSITNIITSLDLNADEIKKCVIEKKYTDKVQQNIDSGTQANVKGTPHSFVLIDQSVYEIPGAYEEKGMREFFDDLLAGKDPKAKDLRAERNVTPVTENDWSTGNPAARITVVMYSDMDCPYCKKFHASAQSIMNDYPDIRWVFRHMPIDALHPQAREKAETAECVGAIGGTEKFWSFLDIMYQQD